MSALRPGNYDRAWNDPPVFAYNAGENSESSGSNATTTTTKRTLLNKRVAFPFSGDSGGMQKQEPLAMPPTLTGVSPPLPPSQLETKEEAKNVENFEVLYSVFQNAVTELLSDSAKASDAMKKLEVMEANWKSGKFNPDVQQRLNNLANAIKEKNYALAEKFHVGLAVDYATECAGWIIAIKHIILQGKEKL